MPTIDVRYSADGNWQVELTAFKIDLMVYKAIGATLVVRHKEQVRAGLFGWGPVQEQWVERPVQSLSVTTNYHGLLPTTVEGVARRSCAERDRSSCDCRLWSVGVGITVVADAATGLPGSGPPAVGAAAQLDVRSVSSVGTANINGELVGTGPVQAP